MKTLLVIVLGIAALLYVAVCGFLYFKQEALLFYPEKLPANYQFRFPGAPREYPITAPDGTQLSGLLFQVKNPKGMVFFLHGNGGSLAGWGGAAATYTRLGYDVFLLDYRGYGKSQGRISSQAQLFGDVEAAYNQLKGLYPESKTVITGYSVGTGPAAWLAARHQPRLLLLHVPYYSMADMAAHTIRLWPILPGWLLRYPLATNEYVQQVSAPVILFHGDRDEVIPYQSSGRLRALLKPGDQLIPIRRGGHNGLLERPQYQQVIGQLL
ncbi:MAG TPA: alpha/beta fold hydrolase [Hymenobacter sp.]|uniref:alpha/beta hydrolase n=1 Tax=Hymenobacter sp. TaxID=1898978 RepID=UPI002D80BFB6|nr:alpha/beta fold hydrolase [Hymenobacter sp.]HET9504395.1 alpha/beta fold hydrolase [Hymenobacter sp.]